MLGADSIALTALFSCVGSHMLSKRARSNRPSALNILQSILNRASKREEKTQPEGKSYYPVFLLKRCCFVSSIFQVENAS